MPRSRASPAGRGTASGESRDRDSASTRAARQQEASRAAARLPSPQPRAGFVRPRRPAACGPCRFPGAGRPGSALQGASDGLAPATSPRPAARRPSAAFQPASTGVNTRGRAAGNAPGPHASAGRAALIVPGSGTPAGRTPAPAPRRINRTVRRTPASGASRTASRGRRAGPSRPGGGRCPCCGGSRTGDRRARCPPTARGP